MDSWFRGCLGTDCGLACLETTAHPSSSLPPSGSALAKAVIGSTKQSCEFSYDLILFFPVVLSDKIVQPPQVILCISLDTGKKTDERMIPFG